MWNFQPDLNVTESTLGNQTEYQHWECAEIAGFPMIFMKAEHTETDGIFNEGTARSFLSSNGYNMKYLKSDTSVYAGTELFGSFGYSAGYNDVVFIPVKYFKDIDLVPQERDLIFDDTQNLVFEITKVDTLTETQESLRVNDRLFSYKVYLKRYSKFYKDSFDTELSEEIFTPDFNDDVLYDLNADLDQAIEDMGIEDDTRIDDIFGDLR
jgi:hypothetical protein